MPPGFVKQFAQQMFISHMEDCISSSNLDPDENSISRTLGMVSGLGPRTLGGVLSCNPKGIVQGIAEDDGTPAQFLYAMMLTHTLHGGLRWPLTGNFRVLRTIESFLEPYHALDIDTLAHAFHNPLGCTSLVVEEDCNAREFETVCLGLESHHPDIRSIQVTLDLSQPNAIKHMIRLCEMLLDNRFLKNVRFHFMGVKKNDFYNICRIMNKKVLRPDLGIYMAIAFEDINLDSRPLAQTYLADHYAWLANLMLDVDYDSKHIMESVLRRRSGLQRLGLRRALVKSRKKLLKRLNRTERAKLVKEIEAKKQETFESISRCVPIGCMMPSRLCVIRMKNFSFSRQQKRNILSLFTRPNVVISLGMSNCSMDDVDCCHLFKLLEQYPNALRSFSVDRNKEITDYTVEQIILCISRGSESDLASVHIRDTTFEGTGVSAEYIELLCEFSHSNGYHVCDCCAMRL